jgi:large subunit ribosomal protein L19
MNLIDVVNQDHANPAVNSIPKFRSGDTLNIQCRIKEGEKSRIQEFEGICIAIKEYGKMNGHFRVRKISGGVGVERVFPFHSPNVVKVTIVNKGNASKAKLFYLRDRVGKASRIGTDYSRDNSSAE